jgi:NAD(P)-dependent dehydrogenase (short-subunit alcohol dehydrogenase family)
MKIAVITGAGQGIGRAIAYHFAAHGYAVSLLDSDPEAVCESVAHIAGTGGLAIAHVGDVACREDVEAWLSHTEARLGIPDVLVNNAGIARNRSFLELSEEDFDRVLAVNLRGTFLCSQGAARRMVKGQKTGAIINLASTRALMSEPGTEAYTASKGALVALTHGMAVSLGPHQIRVNAISPGWIEVSDWKKAGIARAPHRSEADEAQHPVGRVGRPSDIAEACFFLAEAAGFITGQNFIIDGGMTIRMIYAE